MAERAGPEFIRQGVREAKREPSRLKRTARFLGIFAVGGGVMVGSFLGVNQAVIRDLAPLPFDKEDEVVFAINGIEEADEIRQVSTDDVRQRTTRVSSGSNLRDEDDNALQALMEYYNRFEISLLYRYPSFLHNFENYPIVSTTSETTDITYTVYSDNPEPLWQNYASSTFSTDLVEAIEYSISTPHQVNSIEYMQKAHHIEGSEYLLNPRHIYGNERVQFIQDQLTERVVDNQELAGEQVRVFIPSDPSCLVLGIPESLLEDPNEDRCDASGSAPRDMSVRFIPLLNTSTTGFDNVIVLAGARPGNPNNTRFEQLATHEGIHRIHFFFGYKDNPHDQDAIEKNVVFVEIEIFGAEVGNRNLSHSPTSSDEPLIDYEQLYEDYRHTATSATTTTVDEVITESSSTIPEATLVHSGNINSIIAYGAIALLLWWQKQNQQLHNGLAVVRLVPAASTRRRKDD